MGQIAKGTWLIAAVGWTQSLTRLSERQAPEHQYRTLFEHFSEAEVANLPLAIATINAWNRFGVGFAMIRS